MTHLNSEGSEIWYRYVIENINELEKIRLARLIFN